MSKTKSKNHRLNRRHLILGLILNILVIIVAFIIYHQVFNAEPQYFPSETILDEAL